ncbi:BTB/POZ domain-containing protein 6-B-like [Montipora capricornis]|uniref:BTB/POZ domain-containing protein 6-B-like n=1 Tax=Montipora capricornis TaxID=246305 RepID=UPI0035F1A7A7
MLCKLCHVTSDNYFAFQSNYISAFLSGVMDLSSDIQTDDWQSTRETVRERNKYMFLNPMISDISFLVQDSTNKDGIKVSLPAHKYVLAISSPVFFAMFHGGVAEQGKQIELPDCNSECLTEFLRFVYYDELQITANSVLGVMYLAKKYLVLSLMRRCGQFLEDRIDPNNVFETLTQARQFREEELEKRCWFIVDLNTKQCLESPSFLELDCTVIKSLLRRETLRIEESELFHYCLRWAERQCSNEGLEASGSNLRTMLGDAMYFLRFPAMTQKQFAEKVVSQDILTDREALNVFLRFSTSSLKSDVSFPCVPRSGRPMRRCCRYTEAPSPHHWYRPPSNGTGRREEMLSFTVTSESPVYIAGGRVFTRTFGLSGADGRQDKVQLWIKDETQEKIIGFTEGEYLTDNCGAYGGDGIDIKFKTAILIRSGVRYSLRCVIWFSQSVTSNRNTPQKEVVFDQTKFIFENLYYGSHFTEVLFYTPWCK